MIARHRELQPLGNETGPFVPLMFGRGEGVFSHVVLFFRFLLVVSRQAFVLLLLFALGVLRSDTFVSSGCPLWAE